MCTPAACDRSSFGRENAVVSLVLATFKFNFVFQSKS